MVRVGVPEQVDPRLLALFPKDAEVIRIPESLDHDLEIDVWVPPLYPGPAKAIYPHLKGVKVVQVLWAGVDWMIPMMKPGMTLCDAQGAHNIATSEWAVMATLAGLKYLPFFFGVQQSGDWKQRFGASDLYARLHGASGPGYPPVLVEELAEKQVLIVGYGAIGKAIEERLAPFEVNIVRVARRARPAERVHAITALSSLLPSADVVILILPLTAETTGMFGATELGLMKQGALLVNAARGPVVHTDALVEALHSGRIHAAIDVTDPEPLPEGHPLWKAPNLLLTPHVAGSSPRFMERALKIAAAQVERLLKGKPLENIVADGY